MEGGVLSRQPDGGQPRHGQGCLSPGLVDVCDGEERARPGFLSWPPMPCRRPYPRDRSDETDGTDAELLSGRVFAPVASQQSAASAHARPCRAARRPRNRLDGLQVPRDPGKPRTRAPRYAFLGRVGLGTCGVLEPSQQEAGDAKTHPHRNHRRARMRPFGPCSGVCERANRDQRQWKRASVAEPREVGQVGGRRRQPQRPEPGSQLHRVRGEAGRRALRGHRRGRARLGGEGRRVPLSALASDQQPGVPDDPVGRHTPRHGHVPRLL